MSPRIVVFLIGLAGFIGGFCAGQMLLYFMLRHKTNEELKKDRSLRLYGFLNWVVAVMGAIAFVRLYHQYFG